MPIYRSVFAALLRFMKLKVGPYHPEEDSVQITSMDLHPEGTPVLGPLIEASGVKTTSTQLSLKPSLSPPTPDSPYSLS